MNREADAARVAVVCNAESPVSRALAEEYADRRGVRQRIMVSCADAAVDVESESTNWEIYQAQLAAPIRAFLTEHPGIDFLVLTKGIPLRIVDAPGHGIGNNRPAVDSMLAALDYPELPDTTIITFDDCGFTGTAYANRYWLAEEQYSRARFGGVLVTRLDGYTPADAHALIVRAIAAEQQPPTGTFLFDTCPQHGYSDGVEHPLPIFAPGGTVLADMEYAHFNADMRNAAELLRKRGLSVMLNECQDFRGDADLLGYTSWGSNDRSFDLEAYRRLNFLPGAIGDTAVSTSGRTFLATEGGQSLIADLIAQGITGVKGYTDEPFLTAIASPTVLFDRYTAGYSLAESFYAASRFVGWQDIVIGDPICRPFRQK